MTKLKKHFFPHDGAASRDEKIIEMKMEFGAKGYGVFWEILEYLFEQGGSAKYNPRLVAIAIHEDVRFIKRFLSICIEELKLFETDGTYFWSNRLRSELDRIEDISSMNSRNVSKRYESKNCKKLSDKELADSEMKNEGYGRSTTVIQPNNDRTTKDKIKIDKKEENKHKDIYGEFENVHINKLEYSKLLDQLGAKKTNEWIDRLSEYKESKGADYKSDYATIKNWVRKENKKEQPVMTSSTKSQGQVLTFAPRPAITIWDEQEAQA